MAGMSSTVGMRQVSAPFESQPSDKTITGIMYFKAIRQASTATQKQSPGVEGANTGIGDSEFRPNMAWSRSACSVLVGRPVEGPPRWMSQITRGNSTMIARPIASVLRAMPGPEVVVMARAPEYAAPIAEVMAPISSSAWNVITPKFLYMESSWRMSDAGVIG